MLSLLLALLLGEAAARLALNPSDFLIVRPVRDLILGQRLDPYASGHDAWGFRNPEVPDSADAVTIGASQTYGADFPRGSSWPAQLAERLGRRVYNASLPSYSPVQYYELLRRYALRLKPSAVVVGFYFGNDLLESYRMVYGLGHYRALRRLNMPAPGSLRRVRRRRNPPLVARARRWLSGNSVFYRAAVAVLQGRQQRAELVSRQGDKALVRYDHGATSTVFTPAYRLRSLDLSAPVVREGLRLALLEMEQMARLCDSAGVALTIALIPTKGVSAVDRGRSGAAPERGATPAAGERGEGGPGNSGISRGKRIAYVELLPPLRTVVGRKAIYPSDDDGHPTAAGYAIIARAVGSAMDAAHVQRP